MTRAADCAPDDLVSLRTPSCTSCAMAATTTPATLDHMFDDEPPPAYSPTPDAHAGDTSLGYGPSHPFRPAPAPRADARVGADGDVAYFSPPPGRPPPPRHPSATRHPSAHHHLPHQPPPPPRRPGAGTVGGTRPVSEFASDFYAAGTGEPPQRPAPVTDRGREDYPPVPGGYPGARARSLAPTGLRAALSMRTQSTPRRDEVNTVPDDGRPTRIPVPGHPLLHQGQVLVYPANYECQKCTSRGRGSSPIPLTTMYAGFNTGYKHHDVAQPCRRCWATYAKPYAGPITYAPISPGPSSSTATPAPGAKTFQRPLASFVAPVYAPAPSGLGRVASLAPSALGLTHRRSASGPSPFMHGGAFAPPPGAAVVQPGDPRIGGVACWRCDGRGTTSVLFFDRETCSVCGGVGRVF
jgi:hypothetical protein